MKNKLPFITAFILFPFSFSADAQYIIRKNQNAPRVGDGYVKIEVDYHPVEKQAKTIKQSWDFRELKETPMEKSDIVKLLSGKQDRITEFKEDYQVNHYFRSEKTFVSSENKGLNHFELSGDSLLDLGYENRNCRVSYDQPGLIVCYPVTCGYASVSSFSGHGMHWESLESKIHGTITTRSDAFGSLILPEGDTLQSTIRLHIRKEEYSKTYPAGTFARKFRNKQIPTLAEDKIIDEDLIITNIYQWYEEGYRYPVFETVDSYRSQNGKKIPLRQASYVYHPKEQEYLEYDEANTQIRTERQQKIDAERMLAVSAIQIRSYPNPVSDILNVEIYCQPDEKTVLSLFSVNGKEFFRTQLSGKQADHLISINMSNYPRGNYLLTIVSGKEQLSEKIIKQ